MNLVHQLYNGTGIYEMAVVYVTAASFTLLKLNNALQLKGGSVAAIYRYSFSGIYVPAASSTMTRSKEN